MVSHPRTTHHRCDKPCPSIKWDNRVLWIEVWRRLNLRITVGMTLYEHTATVLLADRRLEAMLGTLAAVSGRYPTSLTGRKP